MATIKNTARKPFIEDNDENIFIGLDLPIRRGNDKQGYFASTTTTIEAVKNNIRNLLNTERGERLYHPNFGTNLRQYLFEQMDEENLVAIREKIVDNFKFWMPFVIIRDMEFLTRRNSPTTGEGVRENEIKIKLDFSIAQDPNILNSVQVTLGTTSDTTINSDTNVGNMENINNGQIT